MLHRLDVAGLVVLLRTVLWLLVRLLIRLRVALHVTLRIARYFARHIALRIPLRFSRGVALHIARSLALHIGLRLAWHIGLRFARAKCRIADHGLLTLVAIIERFVASAALDVAVGSSQLRIVLAELFLRTRDQPIVVLGMLIIVFGRDRIPGGLRIARKLNVFFCNMRRVPPNFDVRTV